MSYGTAEIIKADSRNLPLGDDTVDLVVTSPPYFALRSYTDGGEHYEGQIGAEPTPGEFVASLLEVTAECVRVLKPSGSLWVNLGDKYDSGTNTGRKNGGDRMADGRERQSWNTDKGGPERFTMGRPKSLIGIPWRYALRCIDDLGLILRAEVIWSKPNGLPESVTDRVRRSHEQWFHFTLSPRYFSAVDEIREQYEPSTISRNRYAVKSHTPTSYTDVSRGVIRDDREAGHEVNPLGKLPGSVWTVATEPLRVPDHLGVDHFAAFPTEWPRRIIQGWAPTVGVCAECGEGRRPAVQRERAVGMDVAGAIWSKDGRHSNVTGRRHSETSSHTITGYACACPEPTAATTPARILDPFGGTGTVALVAKALGQHGISVDMSADYCRLAEWRTNDPGQLAKAARQPKPTKVVDEDVFDGDLFGGLR